jgi:glyoxylase-like metal-dependent hydrolase (beta-lactamase superfamily II)
VRLTRDVVLVAGGPINGFGVSADADAHCYLLDGGDALALVDCGLGTDAGMPLVLEGIREAGHDPGAIDRLFLTHYHVDHAGGARRFRDELGLRVTTGAETAKAVETGDVEATSFRAVQELGYVPRDYELRPCPVDDVVDQGDERSVGRLTVRYLSTPGHCAGHGSYVVTGGERTYLLAGDAIFAGGRLVLQATWDCDLQASLQTVRELSRLDFDALLPGHGSLALTGGPAHVRAALELIDALGVPPQLA